MIYKHCGDSLELVSELICLVVVSSLRIIIICCEWYMVHFHVFISRGDGSNLQFANKLVDS